MLEMSLSDSEGRAEEKQGGEEVEVEEVEVLRVDNQPAGSARKEEPCPRSPDHGGMQGVTLEGGPVEVQREEVQTLEEAVNQQNRDGEAVLGECHPRRSVPRSLTGSYPDRDRQQQAEEPRGPGPFYYFGGVNGAEIVSRYCESRGWKRIYNKNRVDFKLKWCETKSPVNYCSFREGEQLVYQIPNNKVLTTKIGLLSSLREYERVSSKVHRGQGLRRLNMEEFIPTTFRMDVRAEREAFFAQQEGVSNNESHMWICKPTGLNQGKGIFLLKSQEDIAAFRQRLQDAEERQANRKLHQRQPQARVVQHYIHNPLLLKGKKFDVRSYLLIACTAPYMVFFRHGYVRLTCDLYDPSSNNLSAHLTNQYMQKKNPLYSQLKEDTVWSMESFNAYVNARFQVAGALPRDWVLGAFTKRMQQIMTQCFLAVKSKLDRRLGFFDLIGCDFMVDEDFKVWLLEMNCNPALHTNCEVLKEVMPRTIVETLDLTLEIFNKSRLRKKILPLASQREFVLLYDRDSSPDSALAASKTNTNSEINQKIPKKTQSRRCTSGTGHKAAPSASPDNSPYKRAGALDLRSKDRNRNTLPRVELTLNKCCLHYHVEAVDNLKHSKARPKDGIIASLSSPSLAAGISSVSPGVKPSLPPHAAPRVSVDQRE